MNFVKSSLNLDKVKQTTVKGKLLFSGIGIHNGKAVNMSIEKAKPNTGIIFERVDLKNNNIIKAVIENVKPSQLCTKIQNQYGISVSTIEHLMAAFNGLNIDNALVKVDANELPALDGSSEEYTKKIIKSGIETQEENRKYLKILNKVTVFDNNRYISVLPADDLTIHIEINYPNTIIGNDKLLYTHKSNDFKDNVSKARTFAFAEDIERMRAAGLAIGGNLNNAIVVDKYKIVNSTGLRFNNEFIKHKALDCIGDFYLLGMPIIGKISCFAPGHKINHSFISEILKDKVNYKIENKNVYNETNSYIGLSIEEINSNKKINVA